jgi:hypothetical protein
MHSANLSDREYNQAEIASTGQDSTQAPQSMHVSASISYCDAPSFIASRGQLSAQEPQDMHASLILCAITIYLHL